MEFGPTMHCCLFHISWFSLTKYQGLICKHSASWILHQALSFLYLPHILAYITSLRSHLSLLLFFPSVVCVLGQIFFLSLFAWLHFIGKKEKRSAFSGSFLKHMFHCLIYRTLA